MDTRTIGLTWSGAYDYESIIGYEVAYREYGNSDWILFPIIYTSTHYGKYDFNAPKITKYEFRIRTIDSSNQYSVIKSTSYDLSGYYISGLTESGGSCNSTNIPYKRIYVNNNYIYTDTTSTTFDGGSWWWVVCEPNNDTKQYRIDETGKIIGKQVCKTPIIYKSAKYSDNGYSAGSNTGLCSLSINYKNNIYWGNAYQFKVGTKLYIDSTLKNIYYGDGKWRYFKTSDNYSYFVLVDITNGNIKSIETWDYLCYSYFTQNTTPGTNGDNYIAPTI